MKSKKLIIGMIAVVVLVAAVFAAMALPPLFTRTAEAQEAPAAALQPATQPAFVEGRLAPARSASLSLPAGGRVAELLVEEGATVTAGQPLLRLADARLRAGVAQAEAGLARAQARLDELKAGPQIQEVTASQAAVDAAQARADRLAVADDIRAAEANLAAAQAALAKLREGASADVLTAARADQANAQAAVAQAQAAYDRVKGNADIAARPEALALQQATNAYNAAAARLADLERGASPADLAGARARVAQAQAQLDALKATRPADLAGAQAELRRAQAQLALTAQGARTQTIAAAEADVAAAAAALDQARAALAEAELVAPFTGVVAEIRPAVGEQLLPGATAVILADLSAWQVETTDLTELQVVRVKEGDVAAITFDALPGESFRGVVTRIKAIGQSQKGDISYTAVIRLEQADPRLRWNMTAAVAFDK